MPEENQKTIDACTDLDLALLIQREYELVIQCQGRLVLLHKELYRRAENAQNKNIQSAG